MKHVFLVHSHITFILATSIIKDYSLDSSDVFFLCTRGYNLKFENKIDLNNEFELLNHTGYNNFFFKWRIIDEVDKKLTDFLGGNSYLAYLPHIGHSLFQIIASNKHCLQINIMEEGVNCLSNRLYNPTPSFKRNIIALVNKSGLWGKKRYNKIFSNAEFKYFKNQFEPCFYGISPNSFKNILEYKVRIVPISTMLEQGAFEIPAGSQVLVLESIIEQNNLGEDIFFGSIKRIAQKISSGILYIKFHPYQNKANRNSIIEILKENFELKFIPDSVVMEEVFLNSAELKVFGFTTSLLYYAKTFGHSATSFANEWNADPLYKKYIELNDFKFEELL